MPLALHKLPVSSPTHPLFLIRGNMPPLYKAESSTSCIDPEALDTWGPSTHHPSSISPSLTAPSCLPVIGLQGLQPCVPLPQFQDSLW